MTTDDVRGVFPIGNPTPYTGCIKTLNAGNTPLVRTWYHGTWSDRVASIAKLGLLPSCWFGGDCCCIFGFDYRDFDLYGKYGDWMMEVRSRVELGTNAKAWWVPPDRIVGAWHKGGFFTKEQLLVVAGSDIIPRLGKFGCSDDLCSTQYELWLSAADQRPR